MNTENTDKKQKAENRIFSQDELKSCRSVSSGLMFFSSDLCILCSSVALLPRLPHAHNCTRSACALPGLVRRGARHVHSETHRGAFGCRWRDAESAAGRGGWLG